MKIFPASLLLVGGMGKMGNALSHAWQKAGMPKKSLIINDVAGTGAKSLDEIRTVPECVVLAIKPQSMEAVLPKLAKKFGSKPLYISIAAGKSTAWLEDYLGKAAIIRAMPNTPAVIGEGISALYANKKATAQHKKIAEQLLKAAGEVVWVSSESLMDVVTAISGSGPAYVFLFLECLIEAGVSLGLPENISRQLAIQMCIGSSKLAKGSKESLTKLRADVTSRGGTTEAALTVLMKNDNLQSLLSEAVSKAVNRAKELAQ